MIYSVWRKLLAALAPLVVLGAVLIVGCVGQDDSPKRTTPPFPHKRHVIDEEIECTNCHKDAKKAEEAGMPTLKTCTKCHEGTDEKKKPNELQIKGFIKDEKPVWSQVTKIFRVKKAEPKKEEPKKEEVKKEETKKEEPKKEEAKKEESERKESDKKEYEKKEGDEISFSHKLHAAAKVQCGTCHKGIEQSKLVTAQVRLTMSDCLSCHAKVGVGAGAKDNCKLCHTNVSKEWRPPSHNKNWKELHGRYSGFVRHSTSQSCSLCHTDKSCTECHRVSQPKSHTNYWRLRGHGLTADMDRSSCKACHTEATCIRCHQSVPPQSHRGNWSDQHCLNCHFPLRDNRCFICHKNDIQHRAAPLLPNTPVHKTAQSPGDCMNCHGGLKAKHLYNGDSCLLCHRRS
ncbi:MAG: cytochrome c3 family protein [Planctomycetota bacterium]